MSSNSASNGDHTASALPHIALMGPVLPFRGGIAQYTTQLHRALGDKCILQTISYKRQYPAWLYPGESDLEPGQESYRESGVEYILDSINPMSWRRATHAILADHCELAIFDWWTLFWAPPIALMARKLRRRGVRVAFLCHNLFDHDSSPIKRKFAKLLLSSADAYVVHSSEQAALLQKSFRGKKVVTHPVPLFNQLPQPSARLPKRGRLELLFFGFIRPYKGLDVLIDALAELNDQEIFLTVVGEPWIPAKELRKQIAAKYVPNVEMHLGYVDDRSAAEFFSRADLVVLPYHSASGSGVAATAFHYGCPLLATRTGGFPDVIDEGKTGFLVSPGSAKELAEVIHPLTRERLDFMRRDVHAQKSVFTWDSLARCVLRLTGSSNSILG